MLLYYHQITATYHPPRSLARLFIGSNSLVPRLGMWSTVSIRKALVYIHRAPFPEFYAKPSLLHALLISRADVAVVTSMILSWFSVHVLWCEFPHSRDNMISIPIMCMPLAFQFFLPAAQFSILHVSLAQLLPMPKRTDLHASCTI